MAASEPGDTPDSATAKARIGQQTADGHGREAGPVYGPEELELLAVAFSRTVEVVALPPGAERQPGAEHYAKETVAKVILGLAKAGERDPETIVAQTVDRLTI